MIVLIFIISLSSTLGNSQRVGHHDAINEFYDANKMSKPGPLLIQSISGRFYEENKKEAKSQRHDENRNVQTIKPADTRDFSNYRRVGSFKEAPTAEESYSFTRNQIQNNKNNVENDPSNMYLSTDEATITLTKDPALETQKKELQFESLIFKNIYNNKTYANTSQVLSRRVNNETNSDDSDSSRRLLFDMYYQPVPPEEIMTPTDISVLNINQQQQPTLDKQDKVTEQNHSKDPNDIDVKKSNKIVKAPCNGEENTSKSKELEEVDDEIEYRISEPTKGLGVSEMIKSRMMIMQHPRVCYACSSINDPSCWSPDRRTSVKYCRADHTSCLTKVFQQLGTRYIIRDCGSACVSQTSVKPRPVYDLCTICHYDLCNSAFSAKIQVIIIIIIVLYHIIYSY